MTSGPAAAFDRLYSVHAVSLVRQAFLLCGRRRQAERAVVHAFHLAWQRWPEVAVDRDPAGWVRAAAHERALSPWPLLIPRRRPADLHTVPPDDRRLLATLLALPRGQRRCLVLHEAVGLDLPETAAEAEATTAAAESRLAHARATLAAPDLAPRLRAMASAQPVTPRPPLAIRAAAERGAHAWALTTVTLLLAFAAAVTAVCVGR
ncbi:sigma factor-like helix-turn-helix DNA-binding protein [Streptomyces radicis]|uniref:RNA polymerase sigma factor 70 region 4 type 2 domain-containing protein n=1 Tax=Streptomyces radicis TaxID=1750517 RepID=A0A3A9WC55_9ACTN|nr:sigma factor-like helix-turn-helix DNA-binding protein [Streptomyces radicis]RKN05206.1 hypothetical protein D7319_25885 [Streptomyces radicis]RKN16739.1 hypothetical protein D7318_25250 [Streptomyces radicis]